MINVAPLADVFEFIRNGKSVKQDESTGGLPITRIETIADGTVDCSRVGYAGLQKQGNEKWLLQRGDILFSHINSVEHIGKCALFEGHPENLIHGMNLLALRPKKQVLDARYAYRAMSSPNFRASLQQFVNKAVNQASISTTNLKSLVISLPPLGEQRRIAAILDKADALRRKRERVLDLLDNLAEAIFLEIFGDPVSNPKGLPVVKLGSIVSKIGSGATPKGGDAAYKRTGISLVRSMNVRDEGFLSKGLAFIDDTQAAKLANVTLEPDDVLLNITGASVARVCLCPAEILPARVNQHVSIIRPKDKSLNAFLAAALKMPAMKAKLLGVAESGATRQAITKAQIEEVAVPLPPSDQVLKYQELTERQHIARGLVVKSMEVDNSLFSALQSRAFSGQL